MVDVSVILPAKNAAATIGDQLEALASQSTDRTWEVIVVDNGSDDDTSLVAEQWRLRLPSLSVLRADERAGVAHARNVGASHASGPLILICDADDIVQQGWLDALADGLARYDAVGGALDEDLLNSPVSLAVREPMMSDRLHEGLLGYLPRAVGGNLGIRSEVLGELGGFDETMMRSADTEFSLRLQVAGYTLGYVPEARVHCRHRATLRANLRQAYEWSQTRPLLYRKFRQFGAPRRLGLRSLGGLAVCSWWLVAGRRRRLRWLGMAARVAGRIAGSIRHRTWYI